MKKNVLVLLTIAAAGAGCDADTGADGEADAVEQEAWNTDGLAGCDLVSDDEIEAVLGEALVGKEEGGYYGCRWRTESNVLGLSAFADTRLPEDSCAEGGTSMPYGKSAMGRQEPVANLGDDAVWGSSGDLLVCTGRGLVTVDMEQTSAAMSPPEEKEAAVRIARSALTRLDATGQ